jgi:hypothetical protein
MKAPAPLYQTLLPVLGDFSQPQAAFHRVTPCQGVPKRCRLSWLANSALVYEPKCVRGPRGGGGCEVSAYAPCPLKGEPRYEGQTHELYQSILEVPRVAFTGQILSP